jgi:large subunit ribosomal protein L3
MVPCITGGLVLWGLLGRPGYSKGGNCPADWAMSRTIQGLEIVRVDTERNLLLVKGGVPGIRGSLVRVQASVKSR